MRESGRFPPRVAHGGGAGGHTCAGGARLHGGHPLRAGVLAQTWPAFSSAEQQVSTSRRVTVYGSTLAFGRRSSM